MYDPKSFKDSSFNSWINSLDESEKKTLTAGAALDKYKTHLEQTTKSTSNFSKAMSKVGSFAKGFLALSANVAVMTLISKGIELAAKAWDNYSHSQEKAIERGDSALSNMKSNQKSTVQNTLYECTLQNAFTLERM